LTARERKKSMTTGKSRVLFVAAAMAVAAGMAKPEPAGTSRGIVAEFLAKSAVNVFLGAFGGQMMLRVRVCRDIIMRCKK